MFSGCWELGIRTKLILISDNRRTEGPHVLVFLAPLIIKEETRGIPLFVAIEKRKHGGFIML